MAKEINGEFTQRLTDWYRKNRRSLPWREDHEPYHVWVSEIMLQQTRVEAVRDYYLRFMRELPDVRALAEADEQTLLKLWEGLGYYNRVRNMHRAAVQIVEEKDGRFPRSYEEILALPGIGEYTAGAIASICFDQRSPAVDGNVLRVFSRLYEDRTDIKSTAAKKRIRAYLQSLYPESGCGDFTQALIELGALLCVPKGMPKCGLCPAAEFCRARENGTVQEFPVKVKKKERKKISKTVLILSCEGKTAVRQRERDGLLAGMYEFPNIDAQLTAEQALALAEQWGCEPRDLRRQLSCTHVFSHVEWEMTGYFIACGAAGGGFRWADDREMKEEIPLPSAFLYFI